MLAESLLTLFLSCVGMINPCLKAALIQGVIFQAPDRTGAFYQEAGGNILWFFFI